MKNQDKLAQVVLQEAGLLCGIDTTKDISYILGRRRREGESFYTITLPTFGKAFEKALDKGGWSSDLLQGFALNKVGLPRFLSGFLRIVFDDSGVIRPVSPDLILAIRMIRQVTNLFKKSEGDCTPARVSATLKTYIETDALIPQLTSNEVSLFRSHFARYFEPWLNALESSLNQPGFFGKHGPGAVQEKVRSNAKYSSNTWTERLESVFPAAEALASNLHDFFDQDFRYLSAEQEPPVRVVTVPKTKKAPRIIAIEPSWMQYAQQGILQHMTLALNQPSCRSLKAICGWNDQEPNRQLSKQFSSHATIDLSEASDRVPLQLVETAFRDYPTLLASILASRSTRAELPNGDIITLRKFASMGSALCFPIESVVFATLAIWSVELLTSHRFGSPGFPSGIRVFGDDIIIPKDAVPYLLVLLETFGFKVNLDKSFWTGKFRESCGFDSYSGFDVSYVKVRDELDEIGRHDIRVVKLVALHNHLFSAGMFESARIIETKLCKLGLGYYAPYFSSVCAMWTYDWDKIRFRTSPSLQKVEVKCIRPKFTFGLDPLDSYGALRKFFVRVEGHYSSSFGLDVAPLPDIDHLERAGRPLHVSIHVGWEDPYRGPQGV